VHTEQHTLTQATVIELWSEILPVQPTSLEDEFFDLGGQSLDLVRFLQQVQIRYGTELDVRDLFTDDLTVFRVSHLIDRASQRPIES
jgi:hypothetical protein